ncbi:MAG: hypothetical protein TQ35_0007455 [Candidatus Aramenus sulfurataquae]|jgi:predicted CopG family antitoxin|uniref:Uncharacterized protein n=1 Tax=Candidatus Aramenus sulfurataquae TaxID=1326980 RepID=A0ACC6TQB9_9CREN
MDKLQLEDKKRNIVEVLGKAGEKLGLSEAKKRVKEFAKDDWKR